MGDNLLANATTVSDLSPVNIGNNLIGGGGNVGLIVTIIIGLVLLITAILLLPKFFDRMLNIGPIMGLVVLIAAAAAFPYAVKLALTPTRTSTSASTDIEVRDIQFVPNAEGDLTIKWSTNKAALSAIRYGKNVNQLDKAAFPNDPGTKKIDHEAVIIGLTSGEKYYFEVVVGDRRFNQQGKPIEYLIP